MPGPAAARGTIGTDGALARTSVSIVAAVVRRDDHILMVLQQGPEDLESAWALPGGRVGPGETLREALERELREETGLSLTGRPQLAFLWQSVSSDVEWLAYTFECQSDGDLQPADPDEYILEVQWVELREALSRLGRLECYDCQPLEAWLSGGAPAGMLYTIMSPVPGA